MLSWFDALVKPGSLNMNEGRWVDPQVTNQLNNWSFSLEWKEHQTHGGEETWVWSTNQRVEQFFIETEETPDSLVGKTILDAGCGNGQLTAKLSAMGANLVGIDLHTHLPSSTPQLVFVQGNFDFPPFKEKSIDIVIANGSIHHTPNTKHSFMQLASLVKEGGKLYVWLYRKPESLKEKMGMSVIDGIRTLLCRMPPTIQKTAIQAITVCTAALSRVRNRRKRKWGEMLINNYDTFTPRYRFYHHPQQVAAWFHECGFSNPILTHWDNPYGFGMLATKSGISSPPAGLHYGK